MSLDPYTRDSKNVPRKKYLYQYSFDGEADSAYEHLDFIDEYEAEFEQPKGRRQARKQTNNKRKRVMDFY